MTPVTFETIWLLAPEGVLVALAAFVFVAGAFVSDRRAFHGVVVAGLALAAVVLWRQDHAIEFFGDASLAATSGPLAIDFFGHALRWLSLAVGALLVLAVSRDGTDDLATEQFGALLLVIAGVMLVSMAGDLVLLFVGLELISIPTYLLLGISRANTGPAQAAAQESATKYFLLSILSSALLLYGMSFLYGVGGSTDLNQIRASLAAMAPAEGGPAAGGLAALVPAALVLILAGLGFKLAAAPFHFYAPDVYQGTTNANAGLLAVAPKIAGLVALVRLVVVAMPGVESIAWKMILAIAIVTMTLGNVTALWQQNIRRMMAYSSIAHAGYMLIGVSVGLAVAAGGETSGAATDGVAAALFYLAVYAVATVGVFATLTYLDSRAKSTDTVDDLAGLVQTHPMAAVAMAVFMFSLTGIPPLAGFWGKFSLLLSALAVDNGGGAMQPWFISLAIVGVVNAAISAGYYLRIVGVMIFRPPVNVLRAEGGLGPLLAAVAAAALVVGIGLFSGPLLGAANSASPTALPAVPAAPATATASDVATATPPGPRT